MPRWPVSPRLRSKVTLYFSLTALAASLALAVVTYTLARQFLVDQRETVARTQAFANAKVVNDQLNADRENIGRWFPQLRTESNGFAQLILPPQFTTDARFTSDALPVGLTGSVARQHSGEQYFTFDGQPYLAVGVYLAAPNAQYYEAFPLADTDRTLREIATALGIGSLATTLIAAGLGWWTSRRLLRPLSRVATAASKLAGGTLETRMPAESDPDLDRLATSFNEMADAVQARIEREARFASDVSHELRSPITALGAALEVLRSRREELSERGRQALDLVVSQVHRFDQMVLDLLELSRIDAGATEVHRDELDIAELTQRIVTRSDADTTPIRVDGRLPRRVRLDKQRYERVLTNLIENASTHAGGPTEVLLSPAGEQGMMLCVCDAGPGVARGERERIFERFARGSAARHRIGTGLGLALVAEHAAAHGGMAWVEDRPGGGACFRVTFEGVR